MANSLSDKRHSVKHTHTQREAYTLTHTWQTLSFVVHFAAKLTMTAAEAAHLLACNGKMVIGIDKYLLAYH